MELSRLSDEELESLLNVATNEELREELSRELDERALVDVHKGSNDVVIYHAGEYLYKKDDDGEELYVHVLEDSSTYEVLCELVKLRNNELKDNNDETYYHCMHKFVDHHVVLTLDNDYSIIDADKFNRALDSRLRIHSVNKAEVIDSVNNNIKNSSSSYFTDKKNSSVLVNGFCRCVDGHRCNNSNNTNHECNRRSHHTNNRELCELRRLNCFNNYMNVFDRYMNNVLNDLNINLNNNKLFK